MALRLGSPKGNSLAHSCCQAMFLCSFRIKLEIHFFPESFLSKMLFEKTFTIHSAFWHLVVPSLWIGGGCSLSTCIHTSILLHHFALYIFPFLFDFAINMKKVSSLFFLLLQTIYGCIFGFASNNFPPYPVPGGYTVLYSFPLDIWAFLSADESRNGGYVWKTAFT